MPDLDLGALQAQLELQRSELASSIMSKFTSLSSSSPPTSTSSGAIVPRSSKLGVGAKPTSSSTTAKEKATSIQDAKLKGRLVAKRKRSPPLSSHADAQDDDDEEEGRASMVSAKKTKPNKHHQEVKAGGKAKKSKKDPFDVETKQPPQQKGKVVVDGKEVDVASLTKGQRKKLNKKLRAGKAELEQQAEQEKQDGSEPAPVSSTKSTATATASTVPTPTPAASTASAHLTPLQSQMLSRLSGSRFRTINEQLYTTPSSTALSTFTSNPQIFDEYHAGFRSQVKSWPKNPVDVIAHRLLEASRLATTAKKAKLQSRFTGKIRARYGPCPLVLDLGAGEAGLAKKLTAPDASGTTRFKVLSFDLVDTPDGWVRKVDAASIRSLPLPGFYSASDPLFLSPPSSNRAGGQGDIAIFCLSLMGTNWMEMLLEANRCLRPGAELVIAEVASRIDDIDAFVNLVELLGFKLEEMDRENSHFFIAEFVKLEWDDERRRRPKEAEMWRQEEVVKAGEKVLKPCLYKRR
ncbi:25S rRNA (adenine645-N1)-methyltransferase [Thecaphora frezii]